jgi:hypothetical protein
LSLPPRRRRTDKPTASAFQASLSTPAAVSALENVGRVVEPLFHADEPEVCRDAKSLFMRLVPDVTKDSQLLDEVPKLIESLLASLGRLAPEHAADRIAIAAAWEAFENLRVRSNT